MPATAPLVFINPASSVASVGTPDTVVTDQQGIVLTTAQIGVRPNFTALAVPQTTPSQVVAAGNNVLVDVVNPADGQLFYIGPTSAVTAATGVPVGVGSRIMITGYTGAVYVIGSGPASTLFYRTS